MRTGHEIFGLTSPDLRLKSKLRLLLLAGDEGSLKYIISSELGLDVRLWLEFYNSNLYM
jgi:hypothetical protein